MFFLLGTPPWRLCAACPGSTPYAFTGRGRHVYTAHTSLKNGRSLPFRCPPAANLAGPEARRYGTPFSASEVQLFGDDDKEETWREFLYSSQPFKRPKLRQGGQAT